MTAGAPVMCARCRVTSPGYLVPSHRWIKHGTEPTHQRWLCPDCDASFIRWYLRPGQYVYDAGYAGEAP